MGFKKQGDVGKAGKPVPLEEVDKKAEKKPKKEEKK